MRFRFLAPRFLEKFAHTFWKPSLALWIIFGTLGAYTALIASPPDYQQKEMVRFLYLHVPASWFSLGIYSSMALLSVMSITAKSPQTTLLTKALAIPGTLVTAISLITGSLWGKPVWGTYWAWDARLTSMLILFFIYMGYLCLTYTKGANEKTARLGSFLVIVGFINIPIIKWSVDFWFTLHQPPSIMRFAKPALSAEFWPALIFMVLTYLCFIIATTALLFLKELTRYKRELQQSHEKGTYSNPLSTLTLTSKKTKSTPQKKAA